MSVFLFSTVAMQMHVLTYSLCLSVILNSLSGVARCTSFRFQPLSSQSVSIASMHDRSISLPRSSFVSLPQCATLPYIAMYGNRCSMSQSPYCNLLYNINISCYILDILVSDFWSPRPKKQIFVYIYGLTCLTT